MGLSALLAEGEVPLVVLRPHARRLARPALVLLVLAPAAGYATGAVPAGSTQATIRAVVAGVAALVALRWVVVPFVAWWTTLYVLTDGRLFERAGVVRRTGHDLPLRGVTDVVVAQSLGQRLLRTGLLTVTTEGGAEFVLEDVPAVARLQRSLLAVADDVAERFAARPPARRRPLLREDRADRADRAEREDRAERAPDLRWGGTHMDPEPDGPPDDDPEPWSRPPRREVRRRGRESARRLRELQDQVRRAPAPDSPLEDDAAPPAAPAAEGPPGDEPGGARILRFPRRP